MSNNNQNKVIRTKRAKSGSVSYGERVLLKDNNRSRVNFVPFFIPHTNHTELASKIVTFKKSKDGPQPVEDKSVSLSGDETKKLLNALKTHLAVADEGESAGEFIAIKVDDTGGQADLSNHDPKSVVEALLGVLGQADILEYLKGTALSTEIAEAFRGSIKLKEISTAVNQLKQMLNSGIVSEREYQKWCDEHYWAFGQVKQITDNNRNISISDQVDKLLPDIATGLCDIIELKRPDMNVLNFDKTHRNYYFSADTSSAIGQCHRYLDVLHEVASKGLPDHPEIVAYHPRATIVIGRSNEWTDQKTRALHGLNQRLRSIKIMTFDHLLAQSESILSLLQPEIPNTANNSSAKPLSNLEDEIPF